MFTKLKIKIRTWLQVERGGDALIEDALKKGLHLGKHVNLISVPNFGSEPYLINIGDYTTISFDCAFVNHDAAAAVLGRMPGEDPQTGIFGPITIGKNCFIGCKTVILSNVHIGDNVIIGAGSVVNRDIPDNMVAAGVPCKIICTIEEYKAKHLDEFLYVNKYPFDEKKEYLTRFFAEELK